MADVRNVGPGTGGIGTRLLSLIMDDSQTAFTSHYSWGVQNGNSIFADQGLIFSHGTNTVLVPYVAGGVLLIPPATNTISLSLLDSFGNSLILNPAAPFLWCFANGNAPANLVFTAGATISPVLLYFL